MLRPGADQRLQILQPSLQVVVPRQRSVGVSQRGNKSAPICSENPRKMQLQQPVAGWIEDVLVHQPRRVDRRQGGKAVDRRLPQRRRSRNEHDCTEADQREEAGSMTENRQRRRGAEQNAGELALEFSLWVKTEQQ